MGWDGTWGNHMERCATLSPWQTFRRIFHEVSKKNS